jgi:hypothetical protein
MNEKLNVFLQMLTGFFLILTGSVGFWYATGFLGFVASMSIVFVGFFLTSSRMIIVNEVGILNKPWLVCITLFFGFLIVSFLPFWCFETVNVAEGWQSCTYMDLWEFSQSEKRLIIKG